MDPTETRASRSGAIRCFSSAIFIQPDILRSNLGERHLFTVKAFAGAAVRSTATVSWPERGSALCQSIISRPANRRRYRDLLRPISRQGDAMHDASIAVIVVDRVVEAAAVIPESQGSWTPTESAGEFRPNLVLEQVRQQTLTFLVRHAFEPGGVSNVDVERLAPGFGVRSHHGMHGLV